MLASTDSQSVFQLDLFPAARRGRALLDAFERTTERLLGLHDLDRGYREAREAEDEAHFIDRALRALGIDWQVTDTDLSRVPADGPAVVVANHPFGAVEGMVMASALLRVRSDVRIMANHILRRVPEMRDLCIFVDPFDGRDSHARNVGPLREAVEWLSGGGLLVVFPAGAVSHLHLKARRVEDPAWSHSIGRLIRRTRATVVPAYFDGANGALFQAAGLVHSRIRTALLPRQLINKRSVRLTLRVGGAISAQNVARHADDEALMRYLRLRTYLLGARPSANAVVHRRGIALDNVVAPMPTAEVAAEIERLPSGNTLLRSGEFRVFHALASQAPAVMHEIGRLREITFREVGEGTGRAKDIDRFDEYYTHLVVWHESRREVVGAYRLGRADEILRRYGKDGLYSAGMFKYRDAFFEQLGPALELGRSFIQRKYQRSFAPLLLLWKGIAAYVSAHPRYRRLFGLVSMSSTYSAASRRMVHDFLSENERDDELAGLTRPRNPFVPQPVSGWDDVSLRGVVSDLEGLSSLVSEIEPDGKGVPVLIKQYCKLGGKIAGFNVDRDFSDVLDGLIVVDLVETEPRTLAKYMGERQASQFRTYHRDLPLDGYGMHVLQELEPELAAI